MEEDYEDDEQDTDCDEPGSKVMLELLDEIEDFPVENQEYHLD